MKKVFLVLAVVLLGAGIAWATTIKEDMKFEGRVTIDNPQDINSGVSVSGVSCSGNVGVDGNTSISGTLSVTGAASMESAIYKSSVSPSATANVGVTITGLYDVYNLSVDWDVDLSGTSQGGGSPFGPVSAAGVTIAMPVPSATLAGWNPIFYKLDSGSTEPFFVISGGTNAGYGYTFTGGDAESGVTVGYIGGDANAIDGQTDRVQFLYYYESSAVSGVLIDRLIIDGANIDL